MKSRKAALEDILSRLWEVRRIVEKELTVLESKTCRRKFSLCLDCGKHNDCPRYHRHTKERP